VSSKSNILITIDTEHSIGGHFADSTKKPVPAERIIFCRRGEREYGINLIMDILDQYGLKGVFFVEVEARFYFGDAEILKTIDHIRSRGHEIQLHTHPNFRTFKEGKRTADDFRKYPLSEQTKILQEALQFLAANDIENILAHRCGGFYSNNVTLSAQRACGIKYSSNYNLAFPNCDYTKTLPTINDLFAINSIFEVPVTNFREIDIRKRWNSLQLSASSFSEIKSVLDYSQQMETRLITFITHSFEFVKAKDSQYFSIKPLKFLIKRFENFCRYISDNNDRFSVVTFGQLDKLLQSNPKMSEKRQPFFYKSSIVQTAFRYLENAQTKLY
jgi:hypothetical protein